MIIIAPYAKPLMVPGENPKNYPYWAELLRLIEEPVVQVGLVGEKQLVPDFRKNLSMVALSELIVECRTWISVDSFMPHLAWSLGKPGIVIFSQSDPNIFGHAENTNLLKDRKYLRTNQFLLWHQTTYDKGAYVPPVDVFNALENYPG